ncbi:MAG TPA: type VI secretion system tip protein TssI/VgrG [Gammaproteobacteria bacterium]|nr:type VI secretion system tip protein TssI/VgrG [Gammaproteobacteria bacterium]
MAKKAQPARISTSLPPEDLLFLAMEGTEELGRPFVYQLDLVSSKDDIDLEALLGHDACVELDLPAGGTRYFHGYITDVAQTGSEGRYVSYRAHLRPWLWLLTRSADCKIFQEQSVPDIIKDVFRFHGFSDFKDTLSRTYTKWEYCVQYRETAFNFVSRLMETEGIYYYFIHEQGKHTLVLADSYSGHQTQPGYEQIRFVPQSKSVSEEYISEWLLSKSVQPGTFAMISYDFTKPRANLGVNSAISREHAHSEYEVFDYPGEYEERDDGDSYARARIEELHAHYERVRGTGDARGICAGALFSLAEHPRDDQNREYLIVASRQNFSLGSYESAASDGFQYQCQFEAVEGHTPFRSARLTPRPVVQGPQTAIVVGKPDREIWTDEYGRVKVKFHWDRLGKDENCSCWVRVSQAWAGRSWGGIQIPRIGQEVVVDFLEGDPDQPIITGRVYNADNMPPYPLPDNATMSTMKSNSSKGGGGFNELRFEDKKGEEQVFIHAEKNLDIRVKTDRFETVGQNRHLVVEKDKREEVKNDRHVFVGNHHNEEIGGDYNLKVKGKEAKEVAGSLSLMVEGEVVEVFKDKHSEEVTADYYLKASNIVIEGTENVTVKVGQSYIVIESGGIKIGTTGKIELEATGKIEAKGTGGVKIESPANVDVKGVAKVAVEGTGGVELKSSAIVQVQGSLVKIN